MKKFDDTGFTLIEGLLVVIALSLVAGVGLYVYNANKDTSKIEQSNNQQKPSDPYEGWKVFASGSKKISFSYPLDWALSPDLSNAPPGSNADNSNVTSPNGTTIKWMSDAVGFGGGCWVDETIKLTAVEPLPNIKGLYYVEYGLSDGSGAAVISQASGSPQVGQDTGKCNYYTHFDLPGKPANSSGVLATFATSVKAADKEAVKNIMLSLKQN